MNPCTCGHTLAQHQHGSAGACARCYCNRFESNTNVVVPLCTCNHVLSDHYGPEDACQAPGCRCAMYNAIPLPQPIGPIAPERPPLAGWTGAPYHPSGMSGMAPPGPMIAISSRAPGTWPVRITDGTAGAGIDRFAEMRTGQLRVLMPGDSIQMTNRGSQQLNVWIRDQSTDILVEPSGTLHPVGTFLDQNGQTQMLGQGYAPPLPPQPPPPKYRAMDFEDPDE